MLLIDDDIDDNEFHEIIIQRTGIDAQVQSVSHPLKAIEVWQKWCKEGEDSNYPIPDIVFLDINMPVMTGFELLDRIKQTPDPLNLNKAIHVFMLTTSINPADYKKAMENHGDFIKGYYTKPLTEEIFLEALKTCSQEMA